MEWGPIPCWPEGGRSVRSAARPLNQSSHGSDNPASRGPYAWRTAPYYREITAKPNQPSRDSAIPYVGGFMQGAQPPPECDPNPTTSAPVADRDRAVLLLLERCLIPTGLRGCGCKALGVPDLSVAGATVTAVVIFTLESGV
ncbi:hypothetical protein NDU88_008398 [Pleurodeles waltl]|uniref:Uncharacterized protein n=1 Tax=Pleurodeles waltl TaxID=8319 RepID=A0AAV7QUJ2_PLEWA|nr:hypothetical protein NDU88_008398 [Pleurodeles waltl]